MVQQLLNPGVAIRIDGDVGVGVASEEFLDPQRVRGMVGADQHHVGEIAGDQGDAAQQESADEDLTPDDPTAMRLRR